MRDAGEGGGVCEDYEYVKSLKGSSVGVLIRVPGIELCPHEFMVSLRRS